MSDQAISYYVSNQKQFNNSNLPLLNFWIIHLKYNTVLWAIEMGICWLFSLNSNAVSECHRTLKIIPRSDFSLQPRVHDHHVQLQLAHGRRSRLLLLLSCIPHVVIMAEHTEYSEFCPHRRFKIAFLNATQGLVSSNVLVKILLLCLDLVLQLVHALCPHQHRHHALHLALRRSIISSARNYSSHHTIPVNAALLISPIEFGTVDSWSSEKLSLSRWGTDLREQEPHGACIAPPAHAPVHRGDGSTHPAPGGISRVHSLCPINTTSHPPPHSIFSLFQFSPCLKQILAASRLCLWGPPLIFQHSSTIDFNFMSRPGGLLLSVLSQFGNVLSFPVLVYRLHATVFFYVMADFWRLTSDGWLYTEPSPETHVRQRWRLRHDWIFIQDSI